ncbi:pentatricopeptide repeat-containing protein At1g74600, chloroplastic-like [Pistacia vera]|uniref:pentatricopeptide repeat-containing protein At1g74600, chloroplastic-like n=1 Tax=Pistacia vera TaxID=55513 RepID=UPI001262EC3F|nr:pentatricopeptide repeat-containing protein At1g74600, chloroplastic-like [Pistacia vera]
MSQMNHLIGKNKLTKVSLSIGKLKSSLAVIGSSPSVIISKHEPDVTAFDPFHFFSHHSKTKRYTIRDTKIIHTHLLKSGLLQTNIFFSNSLLDCYCKSSSMVNALKLFDTTPQLNVISWNIMISGYNNGSLFEDSWRLFCRMLFFGFEPDEITYGSVLSACSALQATLFGMQVYSLAIKNGFYTSGYVRAGMIDLFAKNFTFEDALRVFGDASCENVVVWNSIISGAVRNGNYWIALDLFRQMDHRSLVPNSYTFSSVLSACATLRELEIGKEIQGKLIKCGAKDVFLGTAVVDLYAKCGDLDDAKKEFSRMPIRNVVSWTAIISGFVQKGDSFFALKFFKEMRKTRVEINIFTVTSVIAACAKPYMMKEGEEIHSWILKTGFYLDPVVVAALINMYSKIGHIGLTEKVFREMEDRVSPSTWTVMISSFVQNQSSQKAIELLQRMLWEGLKPDNFCISSVLSVIDSLDLGRQIHCCALKAALIHDLSVGCSLLTMYSKCGSLEESYKVFEQISIRDSALWASMIAGYSEYGFTHLAFQLFREMLFEETMVDQQTLSAILKSCFALPSLKKGKEVHGYALRAGIDKETLIGGALVTMYSKCSALKSARRVFDILPLKDQVSCASLISGYAQNGLIEDAVLLFHEMLMSDLAVDSFMLSSVLRAISLLNRSGLGTQLHGYIIKMGLDSEIAVASSLVTMYSKSGSVEDCCKAFEQIDEPDLIAWTALITSYAQNGKGAEALRVFELMKNKGNRPDSVIFVGVLSACSHNGLVEEGYFHFNSMTKDYGIEPNNYHYACMVDLLGRSGRLEEADKFIKNMPIEPDALVWGTLLAACKVHGDIELGRVAAENVMKLDPRDAGAYVSLSNICAEVGHWEDVLEVRSQMRGAGVDKEPGWSLM